MARTFIYALVDPRDGCVRYVGKADDPRWRLNRHVVARHETSRKAQWVCELWDSSLRPQLKVLEDVDALDWKTSERSWIALLKPDMNTMPGGQGGGRVGPITPELPPTVRLLANGFSESEIADVLAVATREIGGPIALLLEHGPMPAWLS